MSQFSVTLDKIVKEIGLEVLYTPAELKSIPIYTAEVNRPGLLLSGYESYFDPTRIQLLGNMEKGYLGTMAEPVRQEALHRLLAKCPPAIIITHGAEPYEETRQYAAEFKVPLLRSTASTSGTMGRLISYLSTELAPRITRHGVLVEVYGEGILILGESGVGKSETAVELVKRGHRLIADDAVELRRVSDRTLVGTSPENIRYFMELRGVGFINVARLFGSGAVKLSEKVDLVVKLEPWDKTKNYSRTGLETETTDILGLKIPSTTIPVTPGRNLSVILEAAAINNRQKKMGYNAAKDLLERLGLEDDVSGR